MHDLRRIDLNLLLTLQALLAEKHVTRAALRLYKSQPAVSHALAQLRDIFQDPLLTRQGGGMALTPRARAAATAGSGARATQRAVAQGRIRRLASRAPLSRGAVRLCGPPAAAAAAAATARPGAGDRPGHQPGQPRGHAGATGRRGNRPGAGRLSGRARRHQARDAVRGTLRQRCRPAIAAPGAACRCRNGWSAPTYWSRCGPTPKRDRRRAEGAGPAPACRPDAAALERVDGSAGRHRPDPDGCQQGLANVASGKALDSSSRPSTCRHSHSSRHGTAGAIPIQRFAG